MWKYFFSELILNVIVSLVLVEYLFNFFFKILLIKEMKVRRFDGLYLYISVLMDFFDKEYL